MVRSALGPFHVEAQDELVEIGGSQYRVHPAGAVFPVMSDPEFDELVEDVRVNGLREPVVVSGDQTDRRAGPGLSVHGCRRRAGGPRAGAPRVASWVMSVNVHRRHLDAS